MSQAQVSLASLSKPPRRLSGICDALNRLLAKSYPDDTNEILTYDENSNITSRTNRAGQTITYEYDALNRLVTKTRPTEPNIVYTYDIVGRICDVNDGGAVTEYYYDRVGRVVDVNDPEDRRVTYEYDLNGNRTKLTYLLRPTLFDPALLRWCPDYSDYCTPPNSPYLASAIAIRTPPTPPTGHPE